jgi:hypothetical protein
VQKAMMESVVSRAERMIPATRDLNARTLPTMAVPADQMAAKKAVHLDGPVQGEKRG